MKTRVIGRLLAISLASLVALTVWCLWMDVNLWSALTGGPPPTVRACVRSVSQAGDTIVDCAATETSVWTKLAVLAVLMFGIGFLTARSLREKSRRYVVLVACLGTTWCFAIFMYSIARTMAPMEPWEATRYHIVIAWMACCAVIIAVSMLGAMVADRLANRATASQ